MYLYVFAYNFINYILLYAITYNFIIFVVLYPKAYKYIMERVAEFVKRRRKQTAMSQQEFAERAGVALTVLRKIEQGKSGLQLEKVNQVLKMFGHELAPVSSRKLNTKEQSEP